MSRLTLRDAKRIIDAHFAGHGGLRSAEAARQAIVDAPEAGAYFDGLCLLAVLDPAGMKRKERIAANLRIFADFDLSALGAFGQAKA